MRSSRCLPLLGAACLLFLAAWSAGEELQIELISSDDEDSPQPGVAAPGGAAARTWLVQVDTTAAAAGLLQQLRDRGIAVARSQAAPSAGAVAITAASDGDGEALAAALGEIGGGVRGFQQLPPAKLMGRPLPGLLPPANGQELVGIDEYNGGIDWTQLAAVRQNLPKITGKGVKIGILDEGVDYRHKALGHCSSRTVGKKSCKISTAWNYYTDSTNVLSFCGNPHGTHVTGVAAGDARLNKQGIAWRGVAPKASLGAYAMLSGCDNFAAGFELPSIGRAAADGMDVISMSWGWTAQFWPGEAVGLAVAAAAANGSIPSAAAGNEGASQGLWSIIAPAQEADAIAVASLDNLVVPGGEVTFDRPVYEGDATITALTIANSAGPSAAPAKVTLAEVNARCVLSNGDKDIKGAAVAVPGRQQFLESRPDCSETSYYYLISAAAAGKAACIILLDTADVTTAAEIFGMGIKQQVFSLNGSTAGAALRAAAGAGPLKLKKVGPRVMTPLPRARLPSDFTSNGPGFNLEMKPDVAAPGGGMWSTVDDNGYLSLSGTSMATPFVSGALGLLRQHKGKLTLDEARGALMSTALPVEANSKLYGKYIAPFARVGAGTIQVYAALTNPAKLSPYRLRLSSGKGDQSFTVQITNSGPRDVTYQITHRPAASIVLNTAWYGSAIANQTAGEENAELRTGLAAAVTFKTPGGDGQSVAVAAGGSASFQVDFSVGADLASEGLLYSGYIVLAPNPVPDGGAAGGGGGSRKAKPTNDLPTPLSLPYQGYSQDYDAMDARAPLLPQYNASSILKGAPGGLYIRCRDSASADCDTRGGDLDGNLTVASANRTSVQVIVATGKPVRELRLQAFNGSSAPAGETAFTKPAGAFLYMQPAGRAYAVKLPALGASGATPYTFKVVVTPAGDGKPAAAAQTFDVRGSLFIV